MKKVAIAAIAIITLAACQNKENKETTVTDEETVIENKADTVMTSTDTVSARETIEATNPAAAPAIETPAKAVAEKPAAAEKVTAVKPVEDVKVEYASFGGKIAATNALSKLPAWQ